MTAVVAAVVTRPRHPLEGLSLPVLGRLRRHGRLELLLVLPDGSKSMIPAAGRAVTSARGRRRWDRWRIYWPLLCWFRLFRPRAGVKGSRLHGSHRARRTSMQPAQLSLLPDQVPAPPTTLLGQLPEQQVAAAISLLARLIAKASAAAPPREMEVSGHE